VSSKLEGSVDLLRVGLHSKISPMLHKFHARAIQDRYRELFRAGTKERVVAPASRLGLDKGYIDEAIEIETTLGSLVRQIELCEQDIATSGDADKRRVMYGRRWNRAVETGSPSLILYGSRQDGILD
jgi:hypothetical protein